MRPGDIVTIHENALSAEERELYLTLSKPYEQSGMGYMGPCVLQIIKECRDAGKDSTDLNQLLDLAEEHQKRHPPPCDHVAAACPHIPRQFLDPISLEVMSDPVAINSGGVLQYFEREPLLQWLRLRGTNPLTRASLSEADLMNAPAHRETIKLWLNSKLVAGLHFNVCDDPPPAE